jgi:DNA-binding NarL/FixJ family response regulator
MLLDSSLQVDAMHEQSLLIVEDGPLVLRALVRLFAASGFEVVTATRCREALDFMQPVSVGVFDVELPDGNGVALAERLMARGVVGRAVFFTGCSDPALVALAQGLGRFVRTSAGPAELIDAVHSAQAELALAAGGEPFRRRSELPDSGQRNLPSVGA